MAEEYQIIEQKTMKALEDIKHIHTNGAEFWLARELQSVLGYATWDSFQPAIARAKNSCSAFGSPVNNHFHHVTKMITLGKGATRDIGDVALSRYACYLAAMNGEPSKPEIAGAQAYFAVQTHRQEMFDQLSEVEKRAMLRDRVKEENKQLGDIANKAGVQDWALFHDAGYRGLYGGLSKRQIMQKKGITDKEDFLDCISRMELAENEFRITQTESKLVRDNVQGDKLARDTHFVVASKIRETIEEIGGKMPELLPREPSIKKLKSSSPKELSQGNSNEGE